MKIIRKNLYRIVISIIIFTLITPVDMRGVLNFSKAAENEIVGNITWNENHTIDGTLIIQPGATLIIKNNATITFGEGWPRLIVLGNLFVNGTIKHPVYFKKSESSGGYSVNIDGGGKAIIKNADISGGGLVAYQVENNFKFINTAYANNYEAGLLVKNGELEIQGTKFHDNKMAVGVESTANAQKVKVQRSSFINNESDIYNESNSSYALNATYNWWNSANGPSKECYTYNSQENCYYDKFSGFINFDPYLTQEQFHDPVIIIPGILGSWKITDGGDWKADPIFKTYESLFETFEKNGYEKDKNLFIFPYQWRDSNINNAILLKQKIQEIKTANNWPKVDVIAHSMGGLLTREYIESENYQGDIDQLVMLGTPNAGSPEDYLLWDGGKIPPSDSSITDLMAWFIFKQEAKEAGFDSIFKYLHNQPIKSAQELLPTYDYLYDLASEKMRSYANNEHYPKNIFLDNLNTPENIIKMNAVVVTNITGKLDNDKTITKIRVGKPSVDENSLWAHGMPENFDALLGDHGLEYGNGDGTVPEKSSESVSSDEQVETNFSHAKLPDKTAKTVFKKITGNDAQKDVPFFSIDKILGFFVFSPIDIQIISPNGKWAGKNINHLDENNQIDGAYYSGFDTENEFLTIPNPEDGEYKIITEGTGNGEYRIEMAKITEDENGTASEITGEINGTAENGIQEEKTVEILEDKIDTGEEENQDTTPPNINITSPQNKIYPSDETIPIEFSITDDSSGVDEEKTKIFLNGEMFSQDKIDASYVKKGEHSLKISAEDKAGNSVEESLTFTIQPTIDSIIKNVEHYYQDKLITKKATYNFLEAKLKVIKIQKMLYDAINFSPWPARLKNQLLKNIARNINRDIDVL
ncbi:MAG: hypothetical protein WA055_01745, partial [Candidatus Moraniibacteriota bacterium]